MLNLTFFVGTIILSKVKVYENVKINKRKVCNKSVLVWIFFKKKNKRTCLLIRESSVVLILFIPVAAEAPK